jgi:branched-chain amino acid transport system substrate-binding protein
MATRRQYLRQAGAAGSVALLATTAGCSGDGGGGGDGGGDGDGGDGGSTGGGSGGLTAGVLTTLQLDTGIATERGAELAAQKINSEGMLDSDVSIASEDTEGQSTVAVEAYNSLVNQENADLTLGTFAEQTGAAILPEIASSRTIHTNVGAISPELPTNLREDYEQFKPWFRVYPPNAAFFVIDMLNFTEQFLVGEQGWSSTALFREDAAWTEQVGGALKQQFPEMGLEVQDDIVFSLSENNFSPYMNQIQDMDVDVVFGLSPRPARRRF